MIRILYIVIITLIIQTFGFIPVNKANAASAKYYFSPSSVNISTGQSKTVSLYISTDQAVNSGSATIILPTNYISASSISKSNSIFSLWTTEPTISGSTINFGGGLSNPGYSGNSGKILSFTITGKSEGTGLISLNSGKILANDGKGTDIYSGTSSSTISVEKIVTGAAIASETHPDQSKWYNKAETKLSWSKPSGYKSFSYELSKDSSVIHSEDNLSDSKATFEKLADGTWTLRLTTVFTDGKSATSSFTLNIDTTAPTQPEIKVAQEDENDQFPIVNALSTDESSGIDYYEIIIDDNEPIKSTNKALKLPKQLPGTHNYSVLAVDRAGNRSIATQGSFFIQGVSGPVITKHPHFVAMLQPIELNGRALYGSQVQVYIDDDSVAEFYVSEFLSDKQERKIEGYEANEDVEWSYTLKQSLLSGVRAVHTTQTTSEGRDSLKSNTVNIRVLGSWISLGGTSIPVPVVLWIALLLLLISIVFTVTIWKRAKHSWEKRLNKLRSSVDEHIERHEKKDKSIRADIEEIKEEIDKDFDKVKD